MRMRERRGVYRVLMEEPEEKKYLKEPDVNGREIIK